MALEITHGVCTQCDWSGRFSCIFSCRCLMSVDIVESENNMKQTRKKVTFFSPSHNFHHKPSARCNCGSLTQQMK